MFAVFAPVRTFLGHKAWIQIQHRDVIPIADLASAEFATHIAETNKSNFHVCMSCRVGAARFAAVGYTGASLGRLGSRMGICA